MTIWHSYILVFVFEQVFKLKVCLFLGLSKMYLRIMLREINNFIFLISSCELKILKIFQETYLDGFGNLLLYSVASIKKQWHLFYQKKKKGELFFFYSR